MRSQSAKRCLAKPRIRSRSPTRSNSQQIQARLCQVLQKAIQLVSQHNPSVARKQVLDELLTEKSILEGSLTHCLDSYTEFSTLFITAHTEIFGILSKAQFISSSALSAQTWQTFNNLKGKVWEYYISQTQPPVQSSEELTKFRIDSLEEDLRCRDSLIQGLEKELEETVIELNLREDQVKVLKKTNQELQSRKRTPLKRKTEMVRKSSPLPSYSLDVSIFKDEDHRRLLQKLESVTKQRDTLLERHHSASTSKLLTPRRSLSSLEHLPTKGPVKSQDSQTDRESVEENKKGLLKYVDLYVQSVDELKHAQYTIKELTEKTIPQLEEKLSKAEGSEWNARLKLQQALEANQTNPKSPNTHTNLNAIIEELEKASATVLPNIEDQEEYMKHLISILVSNTEDALMSQMKLSQELESAHQEKSRLKQEVETLKVHNEQEKIQWTNSIKNEHTQSQAMKSIVQGLEKQLIEVTKQINTLERALAQSKKAEGGLETELQQQRNANSALQAELALATDTIDKLRTEYRTSAATLQVNPPELNQKLAGQLHSLEYEKAATFAQLKAFLIAFERSQTEHYTQHQSKVFKLFETLDLNKLNEALVQLGSKQKTLQTLLCKKTQELMDLQTTLQDQRTELARFEKELAEKTSENSQLTQAFNHLETSTAEQVQLLEITLSEAKQSHSTSKKLIEKLALEKTNLEKLVREHSSATRKYHTLQEEHTKLNEKLQETQWEIEGLQKANQSQKDLIQNLTEQLEQPEQTLAEKDQIIANLKRLVEGLQSDLRQHAHTPALQNEVNKLNETLEDVYEENTQLRDYIGALKTMLARESLTSEPSLVPLASESDEPAPS